MLPLFLFAAADSAVIEEIVVTALKRETTLRDTPLAISAVSGETLVDLGIDNVSDLLRTTPGLAVLDQGAGQRRLIVRGVQSAGESQTGLYYDEAPVGAGSPGTTNDAGQRMPEIERIDAYTLTNLRLRLSNADATWNVDLYVDNVFNEVAIGRVLSSPFGFDLTLSAPPRTIGMGFSMKL